MNSGKTSCWDCCFCGAKEGQPCASKACQAADSLRQKLESMTRERDEWRERNNIVSSEAVKYKQDVEQYQVQLAGCLTAAEGHTQNPAKRGDYGWSLAYQTTLDLRRNYDAARAEIERLKADLNDMSVGRKTWKKAAEDAELQVESLKDILWKGLACLDLHGGNDKELNAKWVTQAHALGERLEGTEKRINDTSPKARQITPEEFAEGLGAKPMTPEEAAFWQRKHGPGSL